MKKITGFLESIIYLLIIFLSQIAAKYIYSFTIFWLADSGYLEIYNKLSKLIGFDGQVTGFIYDTRIIYILIGWFFGLLIILSVSDDLESVFARKLVGKNNIINGLLSVLIGCGLVLVLYSVVDSLSKVLVLSTFYVKNDVATGLNVTVNIIIIGIVIPIFEELLFRWILLSKLKQIMPYLLAITVQSFLFSLFHFNVIQGIYVFILGFICGYVVTKTKVIFNAIIIHMVFNMTNLYLYYLVDFEFVLGQLIMALIGGVLLMSIGFNNLKYTKIANN